jgi:hypothetical protein
MLTNISKSRFARFNKGELWSLRIGDRNGSGSTGFTGKSILRIAPKKYRNSSNNDTAEGEDDSS